MKDFYKTQPEPSEIYSRMEGFDSWLEIDLDAIKNNLAQIRVKTGAEVIPCLKANAYGHGLVPITSFLMAEGVKRVLVAKLWEARQVRSAGLKCGVINLSPLFIREDFDIVIKEKISQTIFEEGLAEGLNEAAVEMGEQASVWVKVDTGLGRVGVNYGEASSYIKRILKMPGLKIEGIFSTLSEEEELDSKQVERFKNLSKDLNGEGLISVTRSIASSNAIFHNTSSYFNAVRPGLSLFGLYPEPGDRDHGIDLRQAMRLIARVEQVKTVEEGQSLTYGRRFVAPRKMKVGTLHIGYSDGYPRELAGKGVIRVKGKNKQVLGTISVNHMIVDLEETETKRGDIVEAIGTEGENSGEKVAARSGLTPYKLCVGLNPLTPRVYYRNGVPVASSSPRLTEP